MSKIFWKTNFQAPRTQTHNRKTTPGPSVPDLHLDQLLEESASSTWNNQWQLQTWQHMKWMRTKSLTRPSSSWRSLVKPLCQTLKGQVYSILNLCKVQSSSGLQLVPCHWITNSSTWGGFTHPKYALSAIPKVLEILTHHYDMPWDNFSSNHKQAFIEYIDDPLYSQTSYT